MKAIETPTGDRNLTQCRAWKMAKELIAGDVLYDRSRYGMLTQTRVYVVKVEILCHDTLCVYHNDPRTPAEYFCCHPRDLVAIESELPAAIVAAIDDILENGFRLDRRPATPAKVKAVNPPARQGMMFSGLDCAAGQRDLFATDGDLSE